MLQNVSVHVPDISTSDGILCVVAVGNILELSGVLDADLYWSDGISPLELAEQGYARDYYRTLTNFFTENFEIRSKGKTQDAIEFLFEV